MFPTSVSRHINEHLHNIVVEIETKNPNLYVFSAVQFRYICSQTTVELTVKEPRQLNVLEEFIIRAGLEFDPPPTPSELSAILGLDAVFVNNTIATLQSLKTLSSESAITVTDEGRLFYNKGTVPQPPYTVNVYAVNNYLEENFVFKSEFLDNVSMQLPDLGKLMKISEQNLNIADWEIEKIQKIVQNSGLNFHQPSAGKLVTDFKILSPAKNVWQPVDALVIFHSQEDKFNIQLRQEQMILKTASKKLNSLLHKGKITLTELCKLSDDNINLARKEIIANS